MSFEVSDPTALAKAINEGLRPARPASVKVTKVGRLTWRCDGQLPTEAGRPLNPGNWMWFVYGTRARAERSARRAIERMNQHYFGEHETFVVR